LRQKKANGPHRVQAVGPLQVFTLPSVRLESKMPAAQCRSGYTCGRFAARPGWFFVESTKNHEPDRFQGVRATL
jgi:hypothetical protein